MQVRGSIIQSIDQFVSEKYSERYDDWKSELNAETLDLIKNASSSDWYPVEDGVINPTEAMCDMFFNKDMRGAWESGRYSAEVALTGIYKIFLLVATPSFLLKRASRIIATFYDPADLKVISSTNDSVVVRSNQLIKSEIVEYRLAGWMEKALELCGCKNLDLSITQSLAKGDAFFEVSINWD
jgi:hypothetical protein